MMIAFPPKKRFLWKEGLPYILLFTKIAIFQVPLLFNSQNSHWKRYIGLKQPPKMLILEGFTEVTW